VAGILGRYFEFLAISVIKFRDRKFWDYHKGRLQELGHPVSRWILFRAGIRKFLREIVNPEQALRKWQKDY
jgi:hypothetical protein